MAPVRMQVFACCFFFAYGFLLLGSAWSISCTASSYSLVPEQTLYSISDDSLITDVTGSDCEYSWALGKHVLANHDDSEPEVVVNHSINHLITSGCFNNTTFSRNCLSEGIGYTVLCESNCTLALLRSLKQKEFGATVGPTVGAADGPTVGAADGPTVGAADGPTVGAADAADVGLIVVLLVVLLGVCLWYKYKDKISSWRPATCNYTAGTAEEGDPRPAEVEAGNA